MEDVKVFNEGMNLDSDERILTSGEYRYALNIRNSNSEQGSVGSISMVEGNAAPAGTVILPSGYNKCVGAIDDKSRNRMLYILWNENGDNRIMMYDYKNDAVNYVMVDYNNTLNLDYGDKITAINVVQGETDSYLLFSNGTGEPRYVNIDAGLRTWGLSPEGKYRGRHPLKGVTVAYNGDVYYAKVDFVDEDGNAQTEDFFYRCVADYFTTQDPVQAGTVGAIYNNGATVTSQTDWELCPSGYLYSDVANATTNEEFYTQIVKPPSVKSDNLYSTNASYPYNNLIGSYWQFKYKYVTSDGRESSWSEISDAPPAFFRPDSIIESSDYQTLLDNNEIHLYLDVPDTLFYKSIKVAVRRSNNDNSPDDWYLMDDISVLDISSYVYTDSLKIRAIFNNGEVLMPLDQTETNQLFSWIPRDVKAQTITSKNRVVYANFTEGRSFSLDGQYGINTNPPLVRFRETYNPWITPDYPASFEIYSAAAASAISYSLERQSSGARAFYFDTPIDGANDEIVAINFSGITAGEPITLKVEASNYMNVGGIFTVESEIPLSFEYTYIPTSTAASAVVQAFTNALNRNKNFFTAAADTSTAGTLVKFDYYGILASSGQSTAGTAGTNLYYLYIEPQKHSTYPTNTTHTVIRKMIDIKGSNLTSQRNFKRGTTQKFGIVYEDEFGRRTSVIDHPYLHAQNPWWKDDQYSAVSTTGIAGNVYSAIGARHALIDLNHDAPSWAEKYYIVKSLDNGLDNHVSMPLTLNTLLPDPNATITNPFNNKYFIRGYVLDPDLDTAGVISASSLGGEEFIYIPLNALQGTDQSYNRVKDSNISYEYTQGDRIRFCFAIQIASSPPTPGDETRYATSELDFEIVQYYESLNCVAVRVGDFPTVWTDSSASGSSPFKGVFDTANQDGEANTTVQGLVFELYTPTRVRTDNFYYEMYSGTVSADTANSRYYHIANGLLDEVNQTSASAATLRVYGDSYLKPRSYPIYVQPQTSSGLSGSATTKYVTMYIEESNYFDKIQSKVWGAGRPNRLVRSSSPTNDYSGTFGSFKRPNTMRYTEPFLIEQGYNGMGTVYDLNFKDTNSSLKSIQKLHTDGSSMLVIHEDAAGFAKTDREVIETVDGGGLTVASDTPISDVTYYGTRNGTKEPESFTSDGYRRYFFDSNNGQVCRLSNDGITVISDYGMSKWFHQVGREIQEAAKSRVMGAFDPRFDEYVLSVYRTFEESSDISAKDVGNNWFTLTIADLANYDIETGDFVWVQVDISGSSDDIFFWAQVVSTDDPDTTTLVLETDATTLAQLSNGLGAIAHLPKINTVGFSEKINKWTSFYGYLPDWISQSGINYSSFRQGYIFQHDDYANPCSFYNVDYDAFIDVVSNGQPTMVKQWLTVGIKGDSTWGNSTSYTPDIQIPDSTTLADTDFEMDAGVITSNQQRTTVDVLQYKEQQLFGSYFKAKDAAAASYFEGDLVKGFWQKTRIQFNSGSSTIHKVISVVFKFVLSQFTR